MTALRSRESARRQFADAMQSALTLDEVGQAFIGHVDDLIEADAFGLYRFGPDARPVDVLAPAQYGFMDMYEQYGRSDDPVLQFVLEQCRPIDSSRTICPDHWQRSGARAVLAEAGLAHSLEAPVIAAGTVVGTINFARELDSRAFSSSDLVSARFVSEQLSLAIERALRFEATRQRLSTLESALDRVPHGIVVAGLDSEPIYANQAARRLLQLGDRPLGHAGHAGEICPGDGDRHLPGPLEEAIDQFRQGRRVHASSSRDTSGHRVAVKSWLLGERHGAVVSVVSSMGTDEGAARVPVLAVLSRREQEIAQLVAEGLTAKQIGERAFISENTVKQHLKRIFAKTDVSSRAGLVQLMWSAGTQ
ncbi:LuxR C-terminal-related transcriptional regulator [Streptomyces phaeochromogenes]